MVDRFVVQTMGMPVEVDVPGISEQDSSRAREALGPGGSRMSRAATTASFGIADGVEIAYLLVARIAREHGIRVLAVKGPMAAEYDLRPSRFVADADMLVAPEGFDRLHMLLLERGWHSWPGREAPRLLAWHHAP